MRIEALSHFVIYEKGARIDLHCFPFPCETKLLIRDPIQGGKINGFLMSVSFPFALETILLLWSKLEF